jgi:RHS repeat-associated protein
VEGPDWHGRKNSTSYDWYYSYDGAQPHAPTHIGERTFTYDGNGNQTGWTHDRNATWRKITWDDENRIQVIEDKGRTSTYGYDDQGQRVIKQSRQNLTVYVNQFFTERNGSIGSKHIFVGNGRILTKVTGGTNFIRSYDGYTQSKTPPGKITTGGKEPRKEKDPGKGKGKDQDKANQGKHLGQEKNADKGKSQGKGQEKPKGNEKAAGQFKDGVHPGQGIFNRSERANEVAQNICKNKHLREIYCNDAGELIVDPGDLAEAMDMDSLSDEGDYQWAEGDWFSESYDFSFLPERQIIKISTGEQLFYYHSDHLGSTGYVTRENGIVHEHIQYFPFGETWVQQGGNTEKSPYLFTSKELDEETGLYYFGARYYDPRTSVWASVDPILGKYLPTGNKDQDSNLPGMGGVFNPMNLGMFTYTQNNPVKFVDPDGNNAGPVYISGPISSTDLQSGNPVIDNTVLGAVNTAINTTNSIVNLGLNALGVIGDAVAPYEGHIITASTATPMTRLAGTLTASLARLGSLTKSSNINAGFISNLSRAAGALDRGGLTAAGRNLQKHGGREGSAFPAARGNAASINQQAQHIVDDILSNPGSTARTRHHARYGDVTEIVAPDGRGIRYDNNNKFMGFLEP